MEERLKLFPLLSLKEMALRKVAVLLWSDPDVLASISRINFLVSDFEPEREWRTVEARVRVKVSQLQLPESLTRLLAGVVRPVSSEIRRWKKCHEERFDLISFKENGLPGSTKLCWTMAGRIDFRKTVKQMCYSAIDVEQHYKIACDYCVEDSIALLWEKLSEESKEYFSDEDGIHLGLSYQWPHILRGEQSKLDEWSRETSDLPYNQHSFESSAKFGNKSAAEYFFQKLTPGEREASVRRSFLSLIRAMYEVDFDYSPSEAICYLLSLMTPQQQMRTLEVHPIPLPLFFFSMIWPDLFLENASLIWKLFPPTNYAHLQKAMVDMYNFKGYFSPQLIPAFFTQSPPDFMKCFIGQESESCDSPAISLLCAFFQHEDVESVVALFRSLNAADRVKLVFHRSVLEHIFGVIFHDDRWPLAEVCLREATLSRGERERLKRHFEGVLERSDPVLVSRANPNLKSFFDFLDASTDDEKRDQKRKRENSSPE